MDKVNMDGWGEATVRTPGSFAGPREMNAVIRELFCHDSILEYQRRVVEAAMREAVAGWRRTLKKRDMGSEGAFEEVAEEAMKKILDSFDPEHDEWDGFFPPVMLCPEHETPVEPKYGRGVAFSACPGVPWCRAHEGVRVQ